MSLFLQLFSYCQITNRITQYNSHFPRASAVNERYLFKDACRGDTNFLKENLLLVFMSQSESEET